MGIPNPTKKNPNPGDFKSHGIFTKKCGIPIPGIPRDFRKSPGFWEFPKNPKNEKKNPKMSENEKKTLKIENPKNAYYYLKSQNFLLDF